ncbi:hypothetical protein BDD14_0452 [Edaphobacter modestus]|uniref:Uncharacterized protein n=1 Tax=Edaphobacter modestus TaxID=388466 RepID=A0A4Q7YQN0_9BACT|nr:hypothetical protein BDD14_0452 [Edaphobacter modestus]
MHADVKSYDSAIEMREGNETLQRRGISLPRSERDQPTHVILQLESATVVGVAQTKIIATMLQFQKSPVFCIA